MTGPGDTAVRSAEVRLLFIGDVFGRPGRRALTALVPGLRSELAPDLVVANGENAASGAGITPDAASEMFDAGVDVITGGNHTWDKREGVEVLEGDNRVLRPLNIPPGAPGRGWGVYGAGRARVAVVSLIGRIFMAPYDCPFRAIDGMLESLAGATPLVFIDIHAEATSEKMALGWYVDGRASAVVGTHTHVQTADERILPRGTAFLTDAGMTGPYDSVIGMRKELVLRRMTSLLPVRYQPGDSDIRLHGTLIEVDASTGRALRIERIQRKLEGS